MQNHNGIETALSPIQQQFLGISQQHLTSLPSCKFLIHQQGLDAFLKLQSDAKSEGFDLQIVSAFRSFDQQVIIWNEKATGVRPILDKNSLPIDHSRLSPEELMFSILQYSAIPGFSRHHWGTDLDIFDKNALPSPDYKIQLTDHEVNNEGIFGPLHLWIDELILHHQSYGFYRPYTETKGKGIMPERWHISHYPTAKKYEKICSLDFFYQSILSMDLMLKNEILHHAPHIFKHYVCNASSSVNPHAKHQS